MVLTLRPAPGGLRRMLLRRLYRAQPRGRLALEYIFAVLRLMRIPISLSSSPCLDINPQNSLQMYASSS